MERRTLVLNLAGLIDWIEKSKPSRISEMDIQLLKIALKQIEADGVSNDQRTS